MDLTQNKPNNGKNIVINTPDYGSWERYPIKTHLVNLNDDLIALYDEYITGNVNPEDYIIMSEKIVAISQGRAFDINELHVRPLAKFLVKFVYKSPYGIGLGSPETMELALRDCGTAKILIAAAASAVTKPFGIRGVFYKVAGTNARAIDGAADYVIPPFNHYVKMAPKDPDKVAKMLSDHVGCGVVVIDANDIGVEVLGRSSEDIDIQFCKQVFKDNPLCQTNESTPLCYVRKAK